MTETGHTGYNHNYILWAKAFLLAKETCIKQKTDFKMCNQPNEALNDIEKKHPDHVKIDWSKSTSQQIVFR